MEEQQAPQLKERAILVHIKKDENKDASPVEVPVIVNFEQMQRLAYRGGYRDKRNGTYCSFQD